MVDAGKASLCVSSGNFQAAKWWSSVMNSQDSKSIDVSIVRQVVRREGVTEHGGRGSGERQVIMVVVGFLRVSWIGEYSASYAAAGPGPCPPSLVGNRVPRPPTLSNGPFFRPRCFHHTHSRKGLPRLNGIPTLWALRNVPQWHACVPQRGAQPYWHRTLTNASRVVVDA